MPWNGLIPTVASMSLLVSKPQIADLEHFLSFTDRKLYPAEKVIFNEGDNSETLYYVLSGSVSVILEDENNREIVLAYLNAGDFFGEVSLFDADKNRSASIRTRKFTELAEISYENFKEYAKSHPEIFYTLGKQMAHRLRTTTQRVADLSFLDVTGRVASALLELSKSSEAITHPDGMQIKITRQELGKLTNCSREMVGRVLKDMEKQGLISVQGKTIIIFGTR